MCVFSLQRRTKPEYVERKAGENVDGAQWKDTVVLEKDQEEFFAGTRVRASVGTVHVAAYGICN